MSLRGTALFLALPLVLLGTSVPTDEEQEKARPDVEELTKADYQALRAGVQSHAVLATALAGYARQSDVDPAARYLLLRASFRQFVNGGEIDAAERMYDGARKRDGVAYALSLARFSASQLNKCLSSRTPGAKEFLDRLAVDDRREKTVENLQMQVAEVPDDAALRGRLAAAFVAQDDWESALSEFERCGSEAAEVVRFERDYPRTGLSRRTTADVADFWWREADAAAAGASESAQAFRSRAVKWYGLAVTNGVLRGVKRQIAEKRIESGLGVSAAAGMGTKEAVHP